MPVPLSYTVMMMTEKRGLCAIIRVIVIVTSFLLTLKKPMLAPAYYYMSNASWKQQNM